LNGYDFTGMKPMTDDRKASTCYPDYWDDSEIQVFRPPLHFSQQHGQWVARFYDPESRESDYVEWTYLELLDGSHTLKALTFNTSEMDKALEAFSEYIDSEVDKLSLPDLY
jgi:hypothetical protein